MNIRSVIKSAVLDILTTLDSEGEYQTLAQGRVYAKRYVPLLDEDEEPPLPAILIYIPKEDAEEFDEETLKIVSILLIECVSTGDTSDEDIDLMSNQVEYLLNQNQTLNSNISSFTYTGGTLGVPEDSNSPILAWKMQYSVSYTAETTADASLLTNLEGIDVDYTNGTGDTINF